MDSAALLPCATVLLLGACTTPGGSLPDASRPPLAPPAVTTAPSVAAPTVTQAFTPSCQTPADCPGRSECVVSSLGPMGCGAGVCCGTQECYNGCRTNADCPRCRPTCFKDGGRNGVCRLEQGL